VTDIDDLLKRANERYANMTPEEQAAMWKAQRESWARAFSTPCDHGGLDFEQCPKCREKNNG
jgi:hypothetical protein